MSFALISYCNLSSHSAELTQTERAHTLAKVGLCVWIPNKKLGLIKVNYMSIN